MKNLVKLSLMMLSAGSLVACSTIEDVNHRWCPTESVEEVSLSADALFRFNQSAVKDLLPKGKKELDQIADKLTKVYSNDMRIHLIGHTDRLGSEKYNYSLGLKRAETVKQYLVGKQVKAPISVESQGEKQPVTTNCVGQKATKALTACLQPDRRVVVQIKGTKKAE